MMTIQLPGRVAVIVIVGLVLPLASGTTCCVAQPKESPVKTSQVSASVKLPPPEIDGGMSLNQALQKRRSIRAYVKAPLALEELSQILWAAQGVTKRNPDLKTSPSAGATFPLETFVVVGDVVGVTAGVYRYDPSGHQLVRLFEGDVRAPLAAASMGQRMVREAPVTVVFAAQFSRTTGRYGKRGVMYVHQETGHAGQNLLLQVTALGLGSVAVGALDPADVAGSLKLSKELEVLYLFPVGRVR